MIALIKFLLLGHSHAWETIAERELVVNDSDDGHQCAKGTRYVLRCKSCGWIKKRDMI